MTGGEGIEAYARAEAYKHRPEVDGFGGRHGQLKHRLVALGVVMGALIAVTAAIGWFVG